MVTFDHHLFDHHSEELTPNCLLTRYDIVFLGPSKLLHFLRLNPWRKIIRHLRRHGYRVRTLSFQQWRCLTAKDKALKRFHLVGDPTKLGFALENLQQHPAVVETLWTRAPNSNKVELQTWLKWAVEVAERDFLTRR